MNHYTNKKSLAKRGHGKLKAFLPFTLLLLGLLVGMNGAYAQEYEGGKLQMSKTFKPTNEDQTEGLLWLETYVTGAHITNTVTPPADIVLVLDMSLSMQDNFSGNTSRVQALQNAVSSFMTVVYSKDIEGAGQNGVIGHRVAVVGFAAGSQSSFGQSAYQGTRIMSTDNMVNYSTIVNNPNSSSYVDALRPITSNGAINTALSSTTVSRIIQGNLAMGTYAQYGLDMAYNVLHNRAVTTYTDSQGVTHDRSTIVVFFTDGYVGGANEPTYFYIPSSTSSTSNNQAAEADAAVYQANRIKGIYGTVDTTKGVTIYTVGIYASADPYAAYITNPHTSSGTNYTGYYEPRTEAANGMMHMVSSDYDYVADMPAPTYSTAGFFRNNTTSTANVANRFFRTDPATGDTLLMPKFFAATNQSGLTKIFSQIASQAGSNPISMTSGTVIQDVISSSFTLQNGMNVNDIEVYAVKCTGATVDDEGNVTSCEFNTVGADTYPDILAGPNATYTHGTKTSKDTNNNILYLDLITTEGENKGAVNEATAEGKENRLRSSDVVTLSYDNENNPKVNITGYNFTAMYCGLEGENGGEPRGRKLVIKIPIKVKEGIWGDEFNTNGPLSFVLPEGDTIPYYFEKPIANVMGTVWTEKVTSQPTDFDPMNIDSPEDLAWFISCVNGRAHYEQGTNNVASNPSLNGKLTADLDMSAHNWVSIGAGYKTDNQGRYVDVNGNPVYQYDAQGNVVLDKNGNPVTVPTVKLAYEGVFDGNGHVITGLKNNAAKYYKLAYDDQYQVLVFPGMFSNVKGNGTTTGVVKNVFVLGADFHARNHNGEKETFVHFGIIADTLTGGAVYNCEAVGRITCNDDDNFARNAEMVLGGLVGYNHGGTIHSSMAMPTLTGYTMGGMIGLNDGSFTNGFTNPVFNYIYDVNNDPDSLFVRPVGGIAGVNATAANIQNCYVRFSRNSNNLEHANFGQVVGNGSFTQASCYTPRNNDQEQSMGGYENNAWNNSIPVEGVSPNLYSVKRNPTHMRGDRSNDNMVGGEWVEKDDMYVLMGGTPLLTKLNANNPPTPWKHTTAGGYSTSPNGGDINGDYPVLVYDGFTCLAGNNGGIGVDYARTLDTILDRHNNYTLNTESSWNNNKYKDTQVDVLKGGAINLFANETTSLGTDAEAGTVVYIDEKVSLLQTSNADIEAYTGQTIIDYGSGYDQQSGNRWHNISSSLKNSMTGLTYDINVQVPSALGDDWNDFVAQYYEQTTDPETGEGGYTLNPNNPCRVKANTTNDDAALFPADMRTQNPFDFYTFFEPEYHWVNFKRNSVSHWHMEDPDNDIVYYHYLDGTQVDGNETQLIPGKGYLLALHFEYFANWHVWSGDNIWNGANKDRTFLQNRGTLNNGLVEIPVTASAPEWTGLKGYNLLGNPYQSYLDFEVFKSVNSALWNGEEFANTYAVYSPENDAWLQYAPQTTENEVVASQYINMHQGFMIRIGNAGNGKKAKFTNDMRVNDPGENYPGFRGKQNYPLINFFLDNGKDAKNVAVLELGRPENGGAEKLNVGSTKGQISLRHDNTDFGILFRDITEGSQPLYFNTDEDGTFTLSWNTANADFSSLTLVDNLTGVKYDMLANDSYTFQGRVTDYRSRFKVVIGRFTDVEENEETVTDNFAFFDGTDWVVNGQGQLTVTDMTGRTIYTANLTSDQSRVNLNGVANGIYLMRVANGQNVNVQKIIIK